MTIDEMIAVLQAARDGKPIQCRHRGEATWKDGPDPMCAKWNFSEYDYRVKPELWRGWVVRPSQGCMGWAFHNQLDALEAARRASLNETHVVEVCEVDSPS